MTFLELRDLSLFCPSRVVRLILFPSYCLPPRESFEFSVCGISLIDIPTEDAREYVLLRLLFSDSPCCLLCCPIGYPSAQQICLGSSRLEKRPVQAVHSMVCSSSILLYCTLVPKPFPEDVLPFLSRSWFFYNPRAVRVFLLVLVSSRDSFLLTSLSF